MDCRINAFPYDTQHRIDFEVKNKTTASFIMIDLDLKDFDSKIRLDNQLRKTLNKLFVTFRHERFHGEAHPTVLWTGNGYHIYQPIEGIVLEKEKIFFDFLPYVEGHDMTTEFLRFAEKYFTNGKADPQHSPSVRSCLVRVPYTFNSKNNEEVKIIQRWNGDRPPIQCLTREFQAYLIQKRINKIKERKKFESKKRYSTFSNSVGPKIGWIDRLLETPLKDYRKYCLLHILVPYLVNVKRLSAEEVSRIVGSWLSECNIAKPLDFDPSREIKNRIRYVRDFKPMSLAKLERDNCDLYRLLSGRISQSLS